LPEVQISPEWVTGPEQGKSSGRIATFNLWTDMFRDGISSIRETGTGQQVAQLHDRLMMMMMMTKIRRYRQILVRIQNIKFHTNKSVGRSGCVMLITD
jgi:hypothetical protein